MKTILIVEDDEDINSLFYKFLKKSGYQVIQAYSGSEAKLRTELEKFDLIILDLMLPGLDGEELLNEIRKKCDVPIIIISAKSSLDDKVALLSNGADDYITKPFEIKEVLARVDVQLRRNQFIDKTLNYNKENGVYRIRDLTVDENKRLVRFKDKELNLTIYEFEILLLLTKNPDKIFSRAKIYNKIWNTTYLGEDNTINMHISNLRHKLLKHSNDEYIKTVWGIGFKISLDIL